MSKKIWSATKQLGVLLVLAAAVAVVGYLFMYGYFDRNRFRILDTPASVRFDDGDMVERWDKRAEDRIGVGMILQPVGEERGEYGVFLYPPNPAGGDVVRYRRALLAAFADTAGYQLQPDQAGEEGSAADGKTRDTGTLRYVPTAPSAWFGDKPLVVFYDAFLYHEYVVCNFAVVPGSEANARLLLDIDYILDSYIVDWWRMRSAATKENLAEIGAATARTLENAGAAASAGR